MLDQLHAGKIAELTARRIALLDELKSDDHYRDTPAVYFGFHDPFDVPLATCDSCYSTAESRRITSGQRKVRWTVACTSCDKQIPQPQKDGWMASLVWNGANLSTQCYKSMPLFGLAHLTPSAAKERISKIRHNLVLRTSLCAVDRAIAEISDSHSKPGLMFQQKLDAYLKWAMHAHRLIKNAKNAGGGKVGDKLGTILNSPGVESCN
ncbi:hypothetical protein ACYSUW_14810 [Pseudomonas frederiksbergensis]